MFLSLVDLFFVLWFILVLWFIYFRYHRSVSMNNILLWKSWTMKNIYCLVVSCAFQNKIAALTWALYSINYARLFLVSRKRVLQAFVDNPAQVGLAALLRFDPVSCDWPVTLHLALGSDRGCIIHCSTNRRSSQLTKSHTLGNSPSCVGTPPSRAWQQSSSRALSTGTVDGRVRWDDPPWGSRLPASANAFTRSRPGSPNTAMTELLKN